MFKKVLAGVLAGAMAVSMVGCSSSSTSTSTQDSVSSEATITTSDNILKIAKSTDIMSLDTTYFEDSTTGEVMAHAVEALFTFDENDELQYAMAESYEISDDGLVYTITLRDVNWVTNTGEVYAPVTAYDFEYAFARIITGGEGYYFPLTLTSLAGVFENISVGMENYEGGIGAKAIDDKTLELTFTNAAVLNRLDTFALVNYAPVCEQFVEEMGDGYALSADSILYNGAFYITDWTPEYGITMVKNEEYYNAGAVSLDGIEFRTLDTQTAVLEYEAGNIDFMELTSDLVTNYVGHDELFTAATPMVQAMVANGNSANEAMDNANFKKALFSLIDKTYITDSLLQNGAVPVDYYMPTEFLLDEEGNDFHDVCAASIPAITYDAEAAVAYLEAAYAEMGVSEVSVNLLYVDVDGVGDMAQLFKAMCEATLPGVTIELNAAQSTAKYDIMEDGDYDLVIQGFGSDTGSPSAFGDLVSTRIDLVGVFYTDTEKFSALEAVVAQLNAAVTEQEVFDAYVALQAVYLENGYIQPLYQYGSAALTKSNVSGIESHVKGAEFIYRYAVKS